MTLSWTGYVRLSQPAHIMKVTRKTQSTVFMISTVRESLKLHTVVVTREQYLHSWTV